jgi:hypothetical protein
MHLDYVMLPPLNPTGIELSFFHDLRQQASAKRLLATLVTWVRINRLTPQECSTLIASGVVSEDAWYDLARRWMLEACDDLESATARADAVELALEELAPLMRRSFELDFYLKTHFPEAIREQRPQAACIH